MLNVGPLELLVVLAVALIVVGPERLPELARSVGRAFRQFREMQDEVRDMVSSGMDDEMREAASEFRKAAGTARRATDVKGAVRRAERSIREETTGPIRKPRTSGPPAPASPTPGGRVDDPAPGSEAASPPTDERSGSAADRPDEPSQP
jgi:sec-independent protein translocase protein TatB